MIEEDFPSLKDKEAIGDAFGMTDCISVCDVETSSRLP